jgi:proteasome lid subunit RPN8/RPN11
MLKALRNFLRAQLKSPAAAYRPAKSLPTRRLIITESALLCMQQSLAAETAKRHEGIAYLLGQTNGSTTIVLGAVRPESHTTRGSFNVTSLAMAKVVRKADDAGLQVVGQIHTHPGEAYHSDGDVEGARIAYDGFVSIVAPDYGRLLPSLTRCAVYFFREKAFVALRSGAITVTNGRF